MIDLRGAHSDVAWDEAKSRLIFALDYPSLSEARAGAASVANCVGLVKVGLELFVKAGPEAVATFRKLGLKVFLDLKLHDIPATVERAVARAAAHGASLLTVHAAGGATMLERAVAAATDSELDIVAVTVLTSLDASDLAAQGLTAEPRDHVLRLAQLAWSAGVRSFVCSPAEAGGLRGALGPKARIITPGVRLAGAGTQDQKRVATPARAIEAGADMLVVGRPIRDAADPPAAADGIVAAIAGALPAARGA